MDKSDGTSQASETLQASETPQASGAPQQAVPYERFQRVVSERNDLKRSLDDALAKLKELSEQSARLERERAEAQGARLRYDVAASVGLPLPLALRLVGDDEKSLREDAERLLALLRQAGAQSAPAPLSGGVPAKLDLSAMTPEEIRARSREIWTSVARR